MASAEKNLVDKYLDKCDCDNERYYDDNLVNDENLKIRVKFDCYDPNTGNPTKVVDGVGHVNDCPYVIIEITMSDIDKALSQIEETLQKIIISNNKVKKILLILHLDNWGRFLNLAYDIKDEKLVFKEIGEFIEINIDNQSYNLYCYLEDFYRYY